MRVLRWTTERPKLRILHNRTGFPCFFACTGSQKITIQANKHVLSLSLSLLQALFIFGDHEVLFVGLTVCPSLCDEFALSNFKDREEGYQQYSFPRTGERLAAIPALFIFGDHEVLFVPFIPNNLFQIR
jgi:hypothetical protein